MGVNLCILYYVTLGYILKENKVESNDLTHPSSLARWDLVKEVNRNPAVPLTEKTQGEDIWMFPEATEQVEERETWVSGTVRFKVWTKNLCKHHNHVSMKTMFKIRKIESSEPSALQNGLILTQNEEQ